ncbi:SubName: Full=Uncharacterized protein {ECO:0000313/EMBL:CCA75194.1} [Serendipita indica DSM 11827]|uniref:Uncharacterized protein n=1 Tax=Serendipita indica (strain DSM 11827) TaxID=1109443 RepID=G4TV51_SERID|nr:SubName: Full=Uncharacterized protein {ECO:0000313/EMBL:CCA75194.1} [Serendipita indica DSM 11827]CCA75194.1 hypothetical protein PIIN_09178 [Serendipita indica DSM 11827]
MRAPSLFIKLLLLQLVSAGSVKVQNKPQVRITTAFVNFHARIMDQWGDGGGKAWTISNDSYHPFVGREFGGAKRRDIRGSNAFGSGYTYGVKDTSIVSGRAFPFGTWPLYWADNFMNSTTEYGSHLDAVRPGGHLSVVSLRSTNGQIDTARDEVYYAIGDSQSLLAILVSYVTWCHADLAWPTRFDPLSPNATVKMENVLQYYRASSFALASVSFTNPQARNVSYDGTYAIPDRIKDSPFWQCLDSTTASALPIMNPPAKGPQTGKIIAIVCPLLWLMLIAAWYLFGMLYFGCLELRDLIWNFDLRMAERKETLRLRKESQMEAKMRRDFELFKYELFP